MNGDSKKWNYFFVSAPAMPFFFFKKSDNPFLFRLYFCFPSICVAINLYIFSLSVFGGNFCRFVNHIGYIRMHLCHASCTNMPMNIVLSLFQLPYGFPKKSEFLLDSDIYRLYLLDKVVVQIIPFGKDILYGLPLG